LRTILLTERFFTNNNTKFNVAFIFLCVSYLKFSSQTLCSPLFETRNPTYLACLGQLQIYSCQFGSQNPSDPFFFWLINEPIKYAMLPKKRAGNWCFISSLCVWAIQMQLGKCLPPHLPTLFVLRNRVNEEGSLLANWNACGIWFDEELVAVFDSHN